MLCCFRPQVVAYVHRESHLGVDGGIADLRLLVGRFSHNFQKRWGIRVSRYLKKPMGACIRPRPPAVRGLTRALLGAETPPPPVRFLA